jgi:hypothetical protein
VQISKDLKLEKVLSAHKQVCCPATPEWCMQEHVTWAVAEVPPSLCLCDRWWRA